GAPPAPAAGPLAYRLGTAVPDAWVPLLPSGPIGGARFLVGTFPSADGGPGALTARRELLTRTAGIPEQELPRDGAELVRLYRYARWSDGSTLLWLAHRKRPGRGEGSSGLRFDLVTGG